MWRGASFHGNASVIWRATHSAVGCGVTLIQTSSLRSSRTMMKAYEQVEAEGRDNEQVHGGDVRRMVTQEGAPSLAGRPPSLDHVLGDARLRDLKPELEQLAVNAWRAPKQDFDACPPDQYAQPGPIRSSPLRGAISNASSGGSRARCQRTSVSGRYRDNLQDDRTSDTAGSRTIDPGSSAGSDRAA